MNTLTKNRILEKGDEYRDNGTWKPIPSNDYGLQIMFTKYAEVRRPSEQPPSTQGSVAATRQPHKLETVGSNPTPAKNLPALAKPRESDPQKLTAGLNTAAESRATPLPISPDRKLVHCALCDMERAHTKFETGWECQVCGTKPISPAESVAPATSTPMAEKEKSPVATPSAAGDTPNGTIKIDYPAGANCIWTGRNGTFQARAINLHKTPEGHHIQIVPVGKRGIAKNAIIEMPVEIIPQVVDWLLRQQK